MSSGPETDRFSLRRADWSRDHADLRLVRSRVFVEEQAVPEELEWDGQDEEAVHLLVRDSAWRPIGTARLLTTGQIGRMAVLPEWRGRGVGSALLLKVLAIACEPGRPPPFLYAQTAALPFYQYRGFVPVGDDFEEAGIPHRKMVFAP